MIGGELAEDQTDGGHVLNAMVAVGGIVQRPGLIDDADRRFLGGDHDLVDLLDAILHLIVQLEGALDRGLRMKFGGKRNFKQHILHHVRAERPAEDERLCP